MGDEATESTTASTDAGSPAASAAPATPPVLILTADQARSTPEYRALEQAHRTLGREKATLETSFGEFRTEAENSRQAAEAQRREALERQLLDQLGADGVAVYQEIAELSQSDPVAAAGRLASLVRTAQGQTPPVPAATAATASTEGEAGTVTANAAASATPPPPSRGVDGGSPLGQASTGEDVNQIVSDLEKTYTDTVARNQDMRSRNRVTMRDRSKAMIAFLGASYLKGGAKPKPQS